MAKIGNLQGLSDLAKAATGRKGKEVITVPLDDVESKEQVRKKFKNIEELAETMKVEGQQSPIIVYPKNENGKYVIQKGERRWRALRVAGIETIDIIVNEKEQSDLDETAGELIENIQRDDLAPLEIANALKKFVDEGWKQKDIAKRLGKNAIFVSTHLSLLKLPECVQELYDEEVCSDTETLNNLRLLYDLNDDRCRAVCAVALEEGITRKQSRDLLNDAKRIKEEMESGVKTPPPAESGTETGSSDGDGAGLMGGDESGGYAPPEEDSSPESGESDSGSEDDSAGGGEEMEDGSSSEKGGDKAEPKQKAEPKNQDAMSPIPEDKDWKFTEPKELIVVVNVATDSDVKRGILLLDRVCKDPKEVWVKIADGKKEKEVRVLASEIELVSMEA